MMKKFLSAILATAMVALALTACTAAPASSSSMASSAASASKDASSAVSEPVSQEALQEESQPESAPAATAIRLAGMTGPTTMGMVKLLEDNASGTAANQYEFTLAGSADEITPKLVSGELDIAAVPANLASVLYNNTKGKVKLLAVNTLGVLYLCEKGETLTGISDLKGRTIYATGKGATPEYTLKYLLSENGMDPETDVTIEWKSEPTEVVAMMEQSPDAVAMLPQPYVTVAMGKIEGLRSAVNLGAEWEKLGKGPLVTGVAVARADFVAENPEAVDAFMTEYSASAAWVNENTADAAMLIEKYGIVKAAVAEKALPACSITFLSGAEMKTSVSAYLEILMNQNPKAVGGALPGDDFYYGG